MDHISLKNAYGFKKKGKRTWQNIFVCVVTEPKTFERYFEAFMESKIELNLSSPIKNRKLPAVLRAFISMGQSALTEPSPLAQNDGRSQLLSLSDLEFKYKQICK